MVGRGGMKACLQTVVTVSTGSRGSIWNDSCFASSIDLFVSSVSYRPNRGVDFY